MRLKSGEKGASGALLVRQCLDLSWHWSGSSAQFLQLPRHCRAQCRPVPSTSSALQCPVSPILPADQCLCPVPAALSASWKPPWPVTTRGQRCQSRHIVASGAEAAPTGRIGCSVAHNDSCSCDGAEVDVPGRGLACLECVRVGGLHEITSCVWRMIRG